MQSRIPPLHPLTLISCWSTLDILLPYDRSALSYQSQVMPLTTLPFGPLPDRPSTLPTLYFTYPPPYLPSILPTLHLTYPLLYLPSTLSTLHFICPLLVCPSWSVNSEEYFPQLFGCKERITDKVLSNILHRPKTKKKYNRTFLAALSSSSWSVRQLVRPSVMFVKKWPLEYQKVIKTYLPTYLWGSSDRSEICDSSEKKKKCEWNCVTQFLWLYFCD